MHRKWYSMRLGTCANRKCTFRVKILRSGRGAGSGVVIEEFENFGLPLFCP